MSPEIKIPLREEVVLELMAACGKGLGRLNRFLDKKSIGILIRETRKSRNMSQMVLAEKLGVSYQQVQKYEKGVTPLTTDRLSRIALALNMPLMAFMEKTA